MSTVTLVRATMLLATIAWAAGEVLMRREPPLDRLARAIWTAGVVLAGLHVLLAFEGVYDWSHAAAVEATMRQAADRFGWGPAAGIYVNYAFLALWVGDVAVWWANPAARAARTPRIEAARVGFFTFMFVNGAIVFASPAGRLVGVPAVGAVLLGSPAFRKSRIPRTA